MLSASQIRGSVRLGPVAGFYPVTGIETAETQLWVPEILQQYEARVLAEIIKAGGVQYDRVLAVARGGFVAGGTVAYSNGYKNLHGIQTIGYSEDNKPLEKLRVINTPDLEHIPRGQKILVVDDLVDKGEAGRATVGWAEETLDPELVDFAVIHVKDTGLPHNAKYFVRVVPNLWNDYESQADKARRDRRLGELKRYDPEMTYALGWLCRQAADVNLLKVLIDASEVPGYMSTHPV